MANDKSFHTPLQQCKAAPGRGPWLPALSRTGNGAYKGPSPHFGMQADARKLFAREHGNRAVRRTVAALRAPSGLRWLRRGLTRKI